METSVEAANSPNAGPRLPAATYTALSSVLLLEDHLPPPWQEAAQSNLTNLFLIHATLAFVGSIFRIHPPYAFPLSLAGLIIVALTSAHSNSLAAGGISTGAQATSHTFLLSILAVFFLLSAPIDLLWLWAHLGSSETRFLVIITTMASLFLKPLTLLTLAQLLRNQGVLDPPAGPNAGPAFGSASYWVGGGGGGALGANGGWLGGGGRGLGPARAGQGMPGSWSAPPSQQSSQPQQQHPRSAASAALAQAQQRQQTSQAQRPYSTASSNFSSERLFSEGYQAYDSDEDEVVQGGGAGGGGERGAVAIPGSHAGSGRRGPPSEADATPISASFAREAGFVSTQRPQS
ncbi:hypothetical protein OC845_004539 [Tilletia horrida]|nr:hypothetical protein OC845_004539 [Tilletia horrida]